VGEDSIRIRCKYLAHIPKCLEMGLPETGSYDTVGGANTVGGAKESF
jgi:hypothetical protein